MGFATQRLVRETSYTSAGWIRHIRGQDERQFPEELWHSTSNEIFHIRVSLSLSGPKSAREGPLAANGCRGNSPTAHDCCPLFPLPFSDTLRHRLSLIVHVPRGDRCCVAAIGIEGPGCYARSVRKARTARNNSSVMVPCSTAFCNSRLSRASFSTSCPKEGC